MARQKLASPVISYRQKRPTIEAKETYRQKRPTIEAKETYITVISYKV